MKLGVFTPLFSNLSLDSALAKLAEMGVDTVELGTGNYPGDAHCKLSMLEDAVAMMRFRETLDRYGATISALSCHGNPLHPQVEIAQKARETTDKTILLAEKLTVSTVVMFSGCPGTSSRSEHPNWVTCPWPPEFLEILEWQWNEVVTPYWVAQAKFAAEHGVRLAIEMHPGFVVYNPKTMLRLREIAGPNVGCNFDPSHLFWQSIEPVTAVRLLNNAIFHVHAKDTQFYSTNLAHSGVLDLTPYLQEIERSWIFRTCGYGHGAEWWKEFLSTLRMIGYDGVISIEHEDSLLSPEEGVRKAARFLQEALIVEKPQAGWWV